MYKPNYLRNKPIN